MTLRHSLFILFLLLTCKDTKFLSEMQVFPTLFHSERYSDVILPPFRRHLRVLPTSSTTRSDDTLGV
jgi:hypothetical protein